MRYDILLADADGTLFDFHAGEEVALSLTLQVFSLPENEMITALYSRINQSHWQKLERGETTQQKLRVERFVDFIAALKAQNITVPQIEPQAISDCFVQQLSRQRIPLAGAKAFLEKVSAHMPIYMITNGIARVQRSRFETSELRTYFTDILISEELQHAKPDPFMLEEALRRAGIGDKSRAVMLGDSVTADIGAANNAGIDSILFTNGTVAPANSGATYTVDTLEKAAALLL